MQNKLFKILCILLLSVFAVCSVASCSSESPDQDSEAMKISVLGTEAGEYTLSCGETLQLTASVSGAVWSSSDSSVVSVEDGLISALKAGVAEITASKDGLCAGIRITVEAAEDVAVLELAFDNARATLSADDSYELSAGVYFGGKAVEATDFAFSSSDTDVISCTPVDGKSNAVVVKALKNGSATVTVTASYNGESLTKSVTVTVKDKLLLAANDILIDMAYSSVSTVSYKYFVNSVETALDSAVNFTSSDTNIVTVDEKGIVTAINSGTAEILITYGDLAAKVEVTVKFSPYLNEINSLLSVDKITDSSKIYPSGVRSNIGYTTGAIGGKLPSDFGAEAFMKWTYPGNENYPGVTFVGLAGDTDYYRALKLQGYDTVVLSYYFVADSDTVTNSSVGDYTIEADSRFSVRYYGTGGEGTFDGAQKCAQTWYTSQVSIDYFLNDRSGNSVDGDLKIKVGIPTATGYDGRFAYTFYFAPVYVAKSGELNTATYDTEIVKDVISAGDFDFRFLKLDGDTNYTASCSDGENLLDISSGVVTFETGKIYTIKATSTKWLNEQTLTLACIEPEAITLLDEAIADFALEKDYSSNIPETIVGNITSVIVNGTAISMSHEDGKLTLSGSDLKNNGVSAAEGIIAKIVTDENIYYCKLNVYTNIITTADEFFTISDDLDGWYLLGSDLDFSAQVINSVTDGTGWNSIGWKVGTEGNLSEYGAFTGTFDGNGYALKNITILGYNATQGINACLFPYITNATIKNVMADITIGSVNADSVKVAGLIGRADYTTIENCIVTLHTQYAGYNSNYNVAPIAGQLAFSSTVNNCIGILDTSAGILSSKKTNFGTIVGIAGGPQGSVTNSYGIYIGASGDTYTAAVHHSTASLKVTNSAAYNGFDAFLAGVDSDNLDIEYLRIENGDIYFGDNKIN